LLHPFPRREHPVDIGYRAFDPAAKRLMNLAKTPKLFIVRGRLLRRRGRLDPVQGLFDPADCLQSAIV